MISLTEDDMNKIQFDVFSKATLSSGSYYVKSLGCNRALRELFGKKIFDMVGISSPEYMYIKDKNCILSSDLNQSYKNFVCALELGDITNMNVLYEILKQFKNYEQLITQVNIMHFIDILFCNPDRHPGNYGFAVEEDNAARLIVFDNELMLEDFIHATRPLSFPIKKSLAYIEYTKECEYKYFLGTLSEKDKQFICYCLQKLDLKTVYSVLCNIEKENNCKFKNKNKIFLQYVKNYLMVYKNTMLDDKKNIKSRKKQIN